MRFSAPLPAASPAAADFEPLAPLLQSIQPEKLDAARLRVAELDRERLIDVYRNAFASGKRLTAFIMADELTKRGIPPCFRLDHGAPPPGKIEQRFDLFVADLRWLRREYPDHAKAVRYRRSRTMLTGSERLFHAEAEYAFYSGHRPAWKIVASLSLNDIQQWDCVWLRSAPIKRHDAATQLIRERVFKSLHDDLKTVRRTVAFTDKDATATLLRRQQLWVCSRMVRDGSPTSIAARFRQMTGEEISRQVAAKQLQKIAAVLGETRDEIEMKNRVGIV